MKVLLGSTRDADIHSFISGGNVAQSDYLLDNRSGNITEARRKRNMTGGLG